MFAKAGLGFYNRDMKDGKTKIQRFATPHLSLDEGFTPSQKASFNKDVQKADRNSKAAQQTYKLQQQINAQSGGRPRYGAITGNDSVAHTARLQLEVEKKRLNTLN
jgi:hypothetical protein